MTPPDFRALCAKLVEVADKLYKQSVTQPHNQVIELSNGQHAIPIGMDVMTQDGVIGNLLNHARATLAQPEPEGPTRRQLMMLANDMGMASAEDAAKYARAVLARWGRPVAEDSSAVQHPQPVPVSERLPGAEDCDAEGNVWAWRRFDWESDMDNGDFWRLALRELLEDEEYGFTHWLPAHDLPLPGEVNHG